VTAAKGDVAAPSRTCGPNENLARRAPNGCSRGELGSEEERRRMETEHY
jgi:hypothetical protein